MSIFAPLVPKIAPYHLIVLKALIQQNFSKIVTVAHYGLTVIPIILLRQIEFLSEVRRGRSHLQRFLLQKYIVVGIAPLFR